MFMGYLHDDEATREAIQNEGWVHTGDLGYMDSNGFIYITGRIKELVITAGGENVAPLPIETQVLDHPKLHSIVEHCVLVGDRQKFLSILLVPFQGASPCSDEDMEEVLRDVNQHAPSKAATVKKWAWLHTTFSIDTGELTPTLKMRRSAIMAKHQDVIHSLYTLPLAQ